MRTLLGMETIEIRRAANATATTVQNMGVDHCRSNILVPKEFLHGSYVVTRLDQMRGERMTERVSCDAFRDIALAGCGANCLGNRRLMPMMTGANSRSGDG